MAITSLHMRIALGLAVTVSLAGCASSVQPPPSSPSAPASVQAELDAAVVATLPKDFASAFTVLDPETRECLTTVTKKPDRYGLSAAALEDGIALLRVGGSRLRCIPVLRVVEADGRPVDLSHIPSYLPVEGRDGDLVIR